MAYNFRISRFSIGKNEHSKVYIIKENGTLKELIVKIYEDSKHTYFNNETNILKMLKEYYINQENNFIMFKDINYYPNMFIIPKEINDYNLKFLFYDYLPKLSLLDYIISNGEKIKEIHVKFLCYTLLNIIDKLHSIDICHNKINISNIMFDDNFNPKLIHFSEAHFINDKIKFNKDLFGLAQILAKIFSLGKFCSINYNKKSKEYIIFGNIQEKKINMEEKKFWKMLKSYYNIDISEQFLNFFHILIHAKKSNELIDIKELIKNEWLSEVNKNIIKYENIFKNEFQILYKTIIEENNKNNEVNINIKNFFEEDTKDININDKLKFQEIIDNKNNGKEKIDIIIKPKSNEINYNNLNQNIILNENRNEKENLEEENLENKIKIIEKEGDLKQRREMEMKRKEELKKKEMEKEQRREMEMKKKEELKKKEMENEQRREMEKKLKEELKKKEMEIEQRKKEMEMKIKEELKEKEIIIKKEELRNAETNQKQNEISMNNYDYEMKLLENERNYHLEKMKMEMEMRIKMINNQHEERINKLENNNAKNIDNLKLEKEKNKRKEEHELQYEKLRLHMQHLKMLKNEQALNTMKLNTYYNLSLKEYGNQMENIYPNYTYYNSMDPNKKFLNYDNPLYFNYIFNDIKNFFIQRKENDFNFLKIFIINDSNKNIKKMLFSFIYMFKKEIKKFYQNKNIKINFNENKDASFIIHYTIPPIDLNYDEIEFLDENYEKIIKYKQIFEIKVELIDFNNNLYSFKDDKFYLQFNRISIDKEDFYEHVKILKKIAKSLLLFKNI